MKLRDSRIDIIRGILIILVVVAHYNREFPHDFIFLFHMPLFFILSGLLLYSINRNMLRRKIRRLIIPYAIYLCMDFVMQKQYSMNNLLKFVWGGRAIGGVYWYITCYLFSLAIFSILIKRFSKKTTIYILIVCSCLGVIESNFIDYFPSLNYPGVPWNLDVSLMAVGYIGIGYFNKGQIKRLIESEKRIIDRITLIIIIILGIFCWYIYKNGERLYYFDMKPVYYKELFTSILNPCAFGIVLARIAFWVNQFKELNILKKFLCLCGQATIPIMFLHIPLNYLKDSIGYGRIEYVIIGLMFPLLFTIVFYKYKIMRILFGLPNLSSYN